MFRLRLVIVGIDGTVITQKGWRYYNTQEEAEKEANRVSEGLLEGLFEVYSDYKVEVIAVDPESVLEEV